MGDFMDFFDLHCDTLTECMDDGDSLLKNERDIDFERGSIFGRWNQVFAVFVPDSMDDSLVEGYFDSACNFYFDELKKKGDVFPILSSEDVRGHSRGVMLAMESSRGVGSLERLEKLYERGLRLITLTWNHKNRAAGGCDEGGGLTDWGRELVSKMEKLGIVTDVSHLSDRSFYDLCEFSDAPFIASHSDARAVHNEVRSLTDEQIKRISEGIKLKDGTKCLPAKVTVIEDGDKPLVEIKICEGKYHQIKRMFAAAGNGVIGLKRTQMGGLMLDPNLKEGEIRLLTVREVQIIENG